MIEVHNYQKKLTDIFTYVKIVNLIGDIKMKLEEFDNLSHDEKKAILLKWWGKNLKGKYKYTLDELVAYSILLDRYFDEILKVAVAYALQGFGPEIILEGIEAQCMDFLFDQVEGFEKSKAYIILKEKFIEDITSELNYPGKSR